jgi:hypothetical protein
MLSYKCNNLARVRKQNCSSFTSRKLSGLVLSVGSRGLSRYPSGCCNVGRVSFFFFCGGRKNQNKFPSNLHCPVKKLNSFLFKFFQYRICLLVCLYTFRQLFCLFTFSESTVQKAFCRFMFFDFCVLFCF